MLENIKKYNCPTSTSWKLLAVIEIPSVKISCTFEYSLSDPLGLA